MRAGRDEQVVAAGRVDSVRSGTRGVLSNGWRLFLEGLSYVLHACFFINVFYTKCVQPVKGWNRQAPFFASL